MGARTSWLDSSKMSSSPELYKDFNQIQPGRPPTLDVKVKSVMCKGSISKPPSHPNGPYILHRNGLQTLKRKTQGEMSTKLFLFVEYSEENGSYCVSPADLEIIIQT
ncbi:hypothetical protein STEG23_004018, partial [Scotinomys teguina]